MEAICSGLGGCKVAVTNLDGNNTIIVTATIRQVGNDQSFQFAEFVPDIIPVNGEVLTQFNIEIPAGQTKIITYKTTVPEETPKLNFKYKIEFK